MDNLFLLLAWISTVLTALLIGAGVHVAYVAMLDHRARRRLQNQLNPIPNWLKRQAR